MDWHQYFYLIFVVVAALGLLFLVIRLMPKLNTESERIIASELVVLGLILACGLAAIYWNYYTGRSFFAYHDVGSDTAEQYVPYYINLLDSIRNGTLGFWNFQYGLGTSFVSYQSWTLDPFNLILIPLGLLFGSSQLSLILVVVQSAKVVACGLLFDLLLTRYCRLPVSRILGSSVFAFCGYLMLWGQHYWLGSVIVMAVVLTLLLEALLDKWSVPRFIGVMVTVAITVMMGTYSGFMVMLYAATYAALRVLASDEGGSPAGFFRAYGSLALPVICGLMVSCLTVIPYATLLLDETSRVSGSLASSPLSKMVAYLGSFVPLRWIPMVFSRLLGNTLVSSGADIPADLVPITSNFDYVNTYEFIQLGLSVGALVLLGQFFHWAATETTRRQKVLISVVLALCVLYCLNFFLPALSNAFVGPKYRSCFAVAIPACIAMAVGWEHRLAPGRVFKPIFAAAIVATVGILAWSFINTVDSRLVCLVYMVACAVMVLAIFTIRPDDRTNSAAVNTAGSNFVAMALCCAAIIGTSVTDGFFATNNRAYASRETFPSAAQTAASTNTEAALTWLANYDTGVYRIEKLYSDWTRLDDSLIEGYMGIASYNSTLDSDIADFYEQLWPGMIVGDVAYQSYVDDPNHGELLNLLGVKYVLSYDELTFGWASPLAEIGSIHIYEVLGTDSMLTLRVNTTSETAAARLSLDDRYLSLITSAIVPDEIAASIVLHSDADTISGSNTGIVSSIGRDSLEGSITATNNGVVACLAIPNTGGWHVYVDGKEVETFRVNYGFIGFEVNAGEHDVVATFGPKNLSFGMSVATAGIILAVCSCAIIARAKQPSALSSNESAF